MKFEEILVHFREGKKARKDYWPSELYVYLKGTNVYYQDGKLCNDLEINNLIFDDWELYEEPLPELLNCPLCNGKSILESYNNMNYKVVCTKCELRTKNYFVESKAISEWNRRV
jgi:hypothetical protein